MTSSPESHDDEQPDAAASATSPNSAGPSAHRERLAEAAHAAAILAVVVCFGSWALGTAQSDGAFLYAYIAMFPGTWIAPTVLVIAGWFFFAFGVRRGADGLSKRTTATLALLISQTALLGLIGIVGVVAISALHADFG